MFQTRFNLTGILLILFLSTSFAQHLNSELISSESLTPENSIQKWLFGSFDEAQAIQGIRPFKKIEELHSPQSALLKSIRLELDEDEVYFMYLEDAENVTLTLPGFNNVDMTFELSQVSLFADGFNIYTSQSGANPVDIPLGRFYRGTMKDDPNSIAAFSVFEDQIFGMVSMEEGNVVIHPNESRPSEYLLYNDNDVTLGMPFSCEALDHPEKIETQNDSPEGEGKCVRVYIETDYALLQNKGDKTSTSNWITAVFNNVATLYTNESVNTTISELFIWTSPDGYSTTSSITALNQFRSKRRSFNGDIAHLAALGGRNLGGVAWLDVLCSSYAYAYSNIGSTYKSVPTYSWTVEVFAHEMGHNLGSNHTQWCGWAGGALDDCYTPEGGCARGPTPTNGGTIMSYCHLTRHGINFNNGFGSQPGDKIRNEVNGAACLGTACGGGGGGGGGACNAPTGLAASSITASSATIKWNASVGAVSYDLEYKKSTAGTWTVVNTTATSRNLTGLSASTTYNTRVKTICTTGSSTYSAVVNFKTQAAGGGGGKHCASKGKDASKEWIRRVRANGFDRRSGSDGGYYDATALVGNMTKGYYNVTYFQANRTGGSRNFYWRIWIDLNQDGDFDDAGELRVSGYSRSIGLLYAYVYIPNSAKTGKTTMRVSMKYGGYPKPCETFNRGEVEDYSINIKSVGTLIEGENEALTDASLFPNPITENSQVEFYSEEDQEVSFIITDLYGRVVKSWDHDAIAGHNFVSLNGNELMAGNYLVLLKAKGETTVLRFVKQ